MQAGITNGLPTMCFLNFSEILTQEQKEEELEKLYSAIGYSENEVITAFPKEVQYLVVVFDKMKQWFGWLHEIMAYLLFCC